MILPFHVPPSHANMLPVPPSYANMLPMSPRK